MLKKIFQNKKVIRAVIALFLAILSAAGYEFALDDAQQAQIAEFLLGLL